MFNFKKIVAGIAVGAMVMGSGVAAFAGNGILADNGKTVQFAAYYGSTQTWAAAPYDMNDANIASADYDSETGEYVLALKTGSYVMPYATMSGTIKAVYTDAELTEEVSIDLDGDGYADEVSMAPGTETTNHYYLQLEAGANSSSGDNHTMTQEVYLLVQ